MIKFRHIFLILSAIFLFIVSFYSYEWSKDFVDPCCNNLCGRCAPSWWECSFMGMVSAFEGLIGAGLILIFVFDFFNSITSDG